MYNDSFDPFVRMYRICKAILQGQSIDNDSDFVCAYGDIRRVLFGETLQDV